MITDTSTAKPPRLDAQQRRVLICSMVIAAGIVLVIIGFRSSVTGRKALLLPPTIESIDPVLTPQGPHLLANFLRQAGEGEAGLLDAATGSFATSGLAEDDAAAVGPVEAAR